jgi:high-affinity iron transporter
MLPTFVIFLREGVEAAMIVAIVLAYLDRIGERRYFRDVWAGVASALLLAGTAGAAAYLTIRTYDGSTVQTVFETVTYLVAAAILTAMTFWMREHARSLGAELRARADAAIGRGERRGLFLLAFQAVGREGIETVVFTLAIAFSTSALQTGIGAALGLAASLAVAGAMYRFGRRINLHRFFSVLGTLLMIFAAALLVDAVENLQQLGVLPTVGGALWNTGRYLAEASSIGDVAHTFLGYVQAPNPLEIAVWLGYLVLAGGAFLRPWRQRASSVR